MVSEPVFQRRQKTGKKGQESLHEVPVLDMQEPELEEQTQQEQMERAARQLPDPCGYKILIGLPEVSDTHQDSVIVKSAKTKELEEVAHIVGIVMKMGPDAYVGEKYPSGPYCKVGDFVMFRAFSGTRFTVYGKEFRMINDDTVEATVEDPRGIMKR